MAKKRKGCCGCLASIGLVLAAAIAGGAWLITECAPTQTGSPHYVRFDKATRMADALARLEADGVVRNSLAARTFGNVTRQGTQVTPGAYRVRGGMALSELFNVLKHPVHNKLRIPEGWWIGRVAGRLEENEICTAEEYRAAVAEAAVKRGHPLEGMLYPDTYDLSPLTPASQVVEMQLRAFEKKARPLIPAGSNVNRVLTVASLIEVEASRADERARIAGIIENRLNKGMRLEIDATVLYALQEWKVLGPGVVRTVRSPYNTYLHSGLPPGPIGSPSANSIRAALRPEPNPYLYYVANGPSTHLFAKTYPEHLQNIRKARAGGL